MSQYIPTMDGKRVQLIEFSVPKYWEFDCSKVDSFELHTVLQIMQMEMEALLDGTISFVCEIKNYADSNFVVQIAQVYAPINGIGITLFELHHSPSGKYVAFVEKIKPDVYKNYLSMLLGNSDRIHGNTCGSTLTIPIWYQLTRRHHCNDLSKTSKNKGITSTRWTLMLHIFILCCF